SVGRLITDTSGRAVVLVNSRDITQHQRAERGLRESETKFRAIFEASPDAKIIFSAIDSRIMEVNPAFTRLFGYRADEATGKTALQLGLWVDSRDMERFLKNLSESGEVVGFEAALRAKDRRAILSAITATTVQAGSPPLVHFDIRDISRNK